ncbi:MarR family transcriptional regulator [Frigoribacterium sp. CG_9.8]|uniref:MarR family transcriptional regulator n=1 Tax=Frigoribacterium sp. CG_9.8 TaxID=2787733 RepID=UPI0018CBC915|nr:DNA-binding MarR family transcriptional regulator [Frigoribacterium sp. CG_9.8]
MYEKFGAAHTLNGFPAATLILMRALDSNRHRIAIQAGITGSELRAMARVAEAGSLTPKQLAESMEMTTGAVTAISTRLVKAKLMHRVDHPSDRRSLFLELTPAANQLMEELYLEFEVSLGVATKDMSEEHLRICAELIVSVAAELGSIQPPSAEPGLVA